MDKATREDFEVKLYGLLQWMANNLDGLIEAHIYTEFENGDSICVEAGRNDPPNAEDRIQ